MLVRYVFHMVARHVQVAPLDAHSLFIVGVMARLWLSCRNRQDAGDFYKGKSVGKKAWDLLRYRIARALTKPLQKADRLARSHLQSKALLLREGLRARATIFAVFPSRDICVMYLE